jgi:murein hydrolase activator
MRCYSRSRCRRVRALFALSILFCLYPVFAAPQDELKELRERIESLQAEIAGREESKAEAADALKQSEQAISQARRNLLDLAKRQEQLAAELSRLEARRSGLQDRVRASQAQLEKILAAEYRGSKHEMLALLLSGKDPGASARELQYYRYIARSRASLIGDLRANLAELSTLHEDTRGKSDELKALAARETQEKNRLEAERGARRQVLVRISGEIEKGLQEITTLKRNEARLTQLVEALARMLAKKEAQRREAQRREADKREAQRKRLLAKRAEPHPPVEEPRVEAEPDLETGGGAFAQLKGRLKFPVRGELANRFGSPRSGSRINWSGLFIRAPEGQEVKAVAPGRVVFADWLRGFGNLLILDHGAGFMSIYGNNETLLKQVGDQLQAGDIVAAVGNSGGNFESGLYFELRHQGKPLDPLIWLVK